MKIYVLSHEYWYGDYKYKYKEESRFIGIYLTRREALKALERFKKIRGFSSHLDGFYIDKTEIDQLSWTDGYRTGYFSMESGMYEEKEKEWYENICTVSFLWM